MSATNVSENHPPHRIFSPGRIWAISVNTLTELVRLKVFYFLLIFAIALIGSSAFLVRMSFQEQFQVLKDISLGAMSIFSALLTMLATAMMLPKDVEDRTLYTILAKPVPRFEYLLGKLGGVLLLVAIAVIAMSLVFGIALMVRYAQVSADMQAEMAAASPEELQAALLALRAQIFDPALLPAIGLIYLKACIFASVTLFLSTLSSSWIFTVMMAVVVYLIGHMQGEARDYVMTAQEGTWWTRLLFGAIAIIFPDLQLFNLVDDIAVGAAISWGLLWKTVGLGVLYFVIYTAASYFVFAGKEY